MTDPGPKTQPKVESSHPDHGRIESFEQTFREHYSFVWRTLAYLGVPEAILDDTAQEVFLVVLRRRDDFDGRSSQRAWIGGIARRVAKDVRKRESRASRRLRVLPDEEPASGGPTGETELARNEAQAFVARFLDTLDADRREVFVLAEVEQMTAPEIAEVLGVKLNTVYSRLRKARIKFQAALGRQRAKEARRDRR